MNSDMLNEQIVIPPETVTIEDAPEPEEQEHSPEPPLPIVEPLFIDEDIPTEIVEMIRQLLLEEEAIFMLFRLNSGYNFTLETGKTEKVPLWTVITGGRLALLAVSSDGQRYCDTFDQHAVLEYQNGFRRDTIKIADKSLFTGLWEGKRWLFKEAANLFPLPEYEKYLYIADSYLQKGEDLQAVPLLEQSITCVPTIKSYLNLVQIYSHHNQRDDAIGAILNALKFTESASLLEESRLLFPDLIEMQLYLAAAFEEQHCWDECIDIYLALLKRNADFDLYHLKLGEIYNAKQDYTAAIDSYQKFITLRTGSDKFLRGEFTHWDMSNLKWFSADPDLVKAYFDVGVIYEYELNDHARAVPIYLALLRHAPFYPDAYKHFWIAYQQLEDAPDSAPQPPLIVLNAFLQVYQLLFPQQYASTVFAADGDAAALKDGIPNRQALVDFPVGYQRIYDAEHDALIHQGEKEYIHQIRQWLTSLIIPEEDGQGIEEYCEQVGASNFPELSHTIVRLADLLNVAPPRCFISRGKIGISVRNKDKPFIFIGSEHLSPDNERYFSPAEMVFIIAAQIEHIKSGHLLLTGTDLWKSLGTASFDGFLVALQCLPSGSFLGRLTHRFATEGLKKVYQMTSYSSLQKILDVFDTGKTDKGADDITDLFEESSKSEKSSGKVEPDSVLKEQIVDFARHAVYTADRVGILASNHIDAACSVIFKLAGNAYDDMKHIHADGLFHVLESQDNRGNYLYFEYAKRFGELITFVLSEEYLRLHSRLTVLPMEKLDDTIAPPNKETADRQLFLHKLQILEQSLENELLTSEEFLRKQKNLLLNAELLQEEDMNVLDKLQQAFLDDILTLEEFHAKTFSLIDQKDEASAITA